MSEHTVGDRVVAEYQRLESEAARLHAVNAELLEALARLEVAASMVLGANTWSHPARASLEQAQKRARTLLKAQE